VHDTAWQGAVPVLDAVAVLDEESSAVSLFLVNRDQTTAVTLDVDVRGMAGLTVAQHTGLFDADPDAVNTADDPDRVVPQRLPDIPVEEGRLQVVLPPLSWNMVRLGRDAVSL
jgi:alpha-N-arabinofuranosidase